MCLCVYASLFSLLQLFQLFLFFFFINLYYFLEPQRKPSCLSRNYELLNIKVISSKKKEFYNREFYEPSKRAMQSIWYKKQPLDCSSPNFIIPNYNNNQAPGLTPILVVKRRSATEEEKHLVKVFENKLFINMSLVSLELYFFRIQNS